MALVGLPKGSGKRLKVREKSVKSQGILKWILSGNPAVPFACQGHQKSELIIALLAVAMYCQDLPECIFE